MTNQTKRFKLLYYLMKSLGEEIKYDEMEMLANKIDEANDERTETVLSYNEDKLLIKLDEKRRIDDGDDIIKRVFEK